MLVPLIKKNTLGGCSQRGFLRRKAFLGPQRELPVRHASCDRGRLGLQLGSRLVSRLP